MLDFIVFFTQNFFNLFLWLDKLTIFGSLSILRVLIIIVLFLFAFKFLKGSDSK